jgi:hypothetical protein
MHLLWALMPLIKERRQRVVLTKNISANGIFIILRLFRIKFNFSLITHILEWFHILNVRFFAEKNEKKSPISHLQSLQVTSQRNKGKEIESNTYQQTKMADLFEEMERLLHGWLLSFKRSMSVVMTHLSNR